mmetsp:Transcript_14052/g.35207  ORF Transcript_14052/g.35207 Transcript_14052/m.35207 type:complete len:332 (+) Transcript_14052:95-1090(+)
MPYGIPFGIIMPGIIPGGVPGIPGIIMPGIVAYGFGAAYGFGIGGDTGDTAAADGGTNGFAVALSVNGLAFAFKDDLAAGGDAAAASAVEAGEGAASFSFSFVAVAAGAAPNVSSLRSSKFCFVARPSASTLENLSSSSTSSSPRSSMSRVGTFPPAPPPFSISAAMRAASASLILELFLSREVVYNDSSNPPLTPYRRSFASNWSHVFAELPPNVSSPPVFFVALSSATHFCSVRPVPRLPPEMPPSVSRLSADAFAPPRPKLTFAEPNASSSMGTSTASIAAKSSLEMVSESLGFCLLVGGARVFPSTTSDAMRRLVFSSYAVFASIPS